jgi:glutamyl-tRNA reductase
MFGCIFDAIDIKMVHISTGGVSADGLAFIQNRFSQLLCSAPHFRWQTCLRHVVVAPSEHVDQFRLELMNADAKAVSESDLSKIEILEGGAAYGRLLELICGLHSPVIGETEVLGQFKEAHSNLQQGWLERNRDAAMFSAFDQVWRNWATALMEDAKAVRSRHLLDLGSQSYGSVVRRELKALQGSQIDVLGAGRLALDIVPFVAAKYEVTIHCRDLLRARERMASSLSPHSRVRLQPITNSGATPLEQALEGSKFAAKPPLLRVLVVAAPMSSTEILSWWKSVGQPSFAKVLDLRAEGRTDAIPAKLVSSVADIRSLDQVFGQIELSAARAKLRREAALGEVQKLIRSRAAMAYHRPFGWDDV